MNETYVFCTRGLDGKHRQGCLARGFRDESFEKRKQQTLFTVV